MPPHALSRSLVPIALLLLLITAVFGRAINNQFVDWDDRNEIFQNPDFNPVTARGLFWNWSNTRLSLYMPITYMTWGGIAAVSPRQADGTLKAAPFHMLSIALHMLNAVLVYCLILQLWHHRRPAFFGAMVFAIHPIQTEAIAWASGMYTLLSTALSLGAMIFYVKFARNEQQMRTSNVERPTSNVEVNAQDLSPFRRWTLDVRLSTFAFFFLATALYTTALLTKAASVSLPLAAAVIDLFILGRSIKRVTISILPWVLLGIPFIYLAKHFQDLSVIPAAPWWARPMVALDALGFYLRKIVLPMGLIPDYGRNPAWFMHHLPIASLSIFIASCTLLAAWIGRRHVKWITASVGLLVAGIAPYLGLTAFDFQYVSTVADRYAYFGMLGVALFTAAILIRFKPAALIVAMACAVWSVLSFHQVALWRDTSTLFNYTLAINPNSLVSHNVLGYMAAHQNPPDYSTAESNYLTALQIWPEDAVIHFNLANLYFKTNPQLAMEHYELAVRYQPNFPIYRNGLAAALARLNRAHDAYDQWNECIKEDPGYVDPHNNLGDLLMNLGRLDEAKSAYESALQIDPTNAHALAKLKQMGN